MERLRAILILRGVFAALFVILGIVLLVTGETVFGLFAVGVGITNAVLIGVVLRQARAKRGPTVGG
jgi:asparagine N-glycosylation enzyme membrane subunit Stt3